MSGNQALNINNGIGPQADLAITSHGSDWYWTLCAVLLGSTLVFVGMSFSKPQNQRLFHYITAGMTLVGAISYYSMAAGLGQTPIPVEFARPGTITGAAGTRQIFYVRYIDWAVSTPLIILDLLLTAGLPTLTILLTTVASEIMVISGLVGALTSTTYKWGYAVFGLFAFFYVAYSLAFDGRRSASALGSTVSRTYLTTSLIVIGFGFLYPIAWGLSEGGNVIHPDSEAVFYGILDFFTKPVFGFLLVFGHRNINPADLGLNSRDFKSLGSNEKLNGHSNGHNGVTNDTAAQV